VSTYTVCTCNCIQLCTMHTQGRAELRADQLETGRHPKEAHASHNFFELSMPCCPAGRTAASITCSVNPVMAFPRRGHKG
jgi:hypothetical protein